MIFKNNNIDSNINLNRELGLYEVKIPGIKRYFQSIYYSLHGSKKVYGSHFSKYSDLFFDDKIIGVSEVYGKYIFCFIDLKNLSSKYYFIESFNFLNLNLNTYDYGVFIYKDFNGNIGYFTDYNKKDYSFSLSGEIFVVRNTIFGSNIFVKNIVLDNKIIDNYTEFTNESTSNHIDIADFFIFKDFFIDSDEESYINFYKFLSTLTKKSIIKAEQKYGLILNTFNNINYPYFKINLSVFGENLKILHLEEFRKLLLSFFTENIVGYLLNSPYVEKYFSEYLNDFTYLDFESIDLDFEIPENIYESDLDFENIKVELLKYKYNLYLLKESAKIKKINSNIKSEHILNMKKRLDLTSYNLDKTIKLYEEKLIAVLNKVKTILGKQNLK